MQFQELVEDQVFSPALVASALRTTKAEIAGTLGLGRNAFSGASWIRARKTQTRLRQMLGILHRVESQTGSALAAYAWFRAEPLPGFGGLTPDQLLRQGRADQVQPISTGSSLVVMPNAVPRARVPRTQSALVLVAGLGRGSASCIHGGRFNRIGVPALYMSLSPVTAMREASPLGRPMQPIVLCAYEVDAEPIFDALTLSEREAHAVTDFELSCPDWEREMLDGAIPASQALADRLIAAGYLGMRVQMVFWHWSDRRPSRVVVIDDEGRLPKNPSS